MCASNEYIYPCLLSNYVILEFVCSRFFPICLFEDCGCWICMRISRCGGASALFVFCALVCGVWLSAVWIEQPYKPIDVINANTQTKIIWSRKNEKTKNVVRRNVKQDRCEQEKKSKQSNRNNAIFSCSRVLILHLRIVRCNPFQRFGRPPSKYIIFNLFFSAILLCLCLCSRSCFVCSIFKCFQRKSVLQYMYDVSYFDDRFVWISERSSQRLQYDAITNARMIHSILQSYQARRDARHGWTHPRHLNIINNECHSFLGDWHTWDANNVSTSFD